MSDCISLFKLVFNIFYVKITKIYMHIYAYKHFSYIYICVCVCVCVYRLTHVYVAKTYKKAPPNVETAINLEAKSIATNLNLNGKIKRLAQTPAYITLKNHKENFRSNTSYFLINPSTELRRINKSILDRINNKLLSKLNYNQWKTLIMLYKLVSEYYQ